MKILRFSVYYITSGSAYDPYTKYSHRVIKKLSNKFYQGASTIIRFLAIRLQADIIHVLSSLPPFATEDRKQNV